MNTLENLERTLRPAHRLLPAAYRVGRMDISGTHLVDENGDPWIGRGMVFGHGENGNDLDASLISQLGFNWVRIGLRRWGTWNGLIVDSTDQTQTSLTAEAYLTTLRNRFIQAREQGLKTILFFDSNCGQFERTGDTTCMLGTDSPQTFWTTGGQTKLNEHEFVMRWVVRVLRGLVDFVEVVVEPHPVTTIPTGDLETDVKLVQARLMDAVLQEDPEMIFIIGAAPSYQNNKIVGWFEPSWLGKYKIVYTCNLLDNISTSPLAAMQAAVKALTDTRALGAPVCCQQVGTQRSSDPTDSYARAVLNELNNPSGGGGSINWTWWEWISPNSLSYGYLIGDGITRAIASPPRSAIVDAISGPRLFV